MADNDALLTNQMPHSPQAEQAVLGSMLIDADCVKDVMDQLQTQDFYLRTNRDIFETIGSRGCEQADDSPENVILADILRFFKAHTSSFYCKASAG